VNIEYGPSGDLAGHFLVQAALSGDQPRVACQRPLQFPLENLALHRPTPLLPPSLPLPVATAPAAEILTTTLPPPLTLPDTSAAPFDEMRPLVTRNG
jgi:hypothetical protein